MGLVPDLRHQLSCPITSSSKPSLVPWTLIHQALMPLGLTPGISFPIGPIPRIPCNRTFWMDGKQLQTSYPPPPAGAQLPAFLTTPPLWGSSGPETRTTRAGAGATITSSLLDEWGTGSGPGPAALAAAVTSPLSPQLMDAVMLQLTRARNRLTTPATLTLPEIAASGLTVSALGQESRSSGKGHWGAKGS